MYSRWIHKDRWPLRIKEDRDMLYYALIFLLIGLVAGALGLFGVAQIASHISWILFLIGMSDTLVAI